MKNPKNEEYLGHRIQVIADDYWTTPAKPTFSPGAVVSRCVLINAPPSLAENYSSNYAFFLIELEAPNELTVPKIEPSARKYIVIQMLQDPSIMKKEFAGAFQGPSSSVKI